jgi:hypothetical protein
VAQVNRKAATFSGARLRTCCGLVVRGAAVAALSLMAGWSMVDASGGPPSGKQSGQATYTISGTVTSGPARLPGVTITVTSGGGSAPMTTSSGLDGTYSVKVPQAGRYEVRAELPVFAPVTREVVVGADGHGRLDLELTLASRAPSAAPVQATQLPAPAPARSSAPAQQRFQQVAPGAAAGATAQQDQSTAAAAGEDPEAVIAHLSLPPGFAPDTLSQSIAAFGSSGQTNDTMLFGPGRDMLFAGGRGGFPGAEGAPGAPGEEGQAGAFGQQAGLPGATLGRGGGPGGRGDSGGRGGGMGGMGGGRGMGGRGGGGEGPLAGRLALASERNNRPRGQFSYTLGSSALNAQPYVINREKAQNSGYTQQRFAASIGGQAKIPKLFDLGTRSSFFLNYSGNHSSNLYAPTSPSTVPTLAERAGDFSALPVQLIDPSTNLPFEDNTIPREQMSAAALALLKYIPEPNLPGDTSNFYYSTTNHTSSDSVNFRFVRSFGSTTNRRPGGRGGAGGFGGGRGGGRGGMGGGINLNVGIQYQRSNSTQSNAFPTIYGTQKGTGWNVPVSFSFPTWGLLHSFRFQINRSSSQTANAFTGLVDPSAVAAIGGVSADPFDWGVPTLSFRSLTGLRDINPSLHRDQTLTFSDTVARMIGRTHTIRTGVEFRDLRVDSRTDASANGSFVFTGAYSGVDFADFLLGLAQQASVQYGPGLEQFRTRAWAAYLQDDWRVRSNFSLNLGVRYEYQAPYWSVDNRLVNLDVNSSFTAAVPVLAGGIGPYGGLFPDALVKPDRNNFAPRTGFAWRPKPHWMVRGGYGINYSSMPYLSIVQKLAAQPPFATTATIGDIINETDGPNPLPLATVLTDIPVQVTTNNFGVDPNYSIGYVHIWNVDVQRDFGRTMSIGAAYIGTKGAQLDILRAPNRMPDGSLRIEGVQPFTWESSGAHSIMHSLSLRINRRLAQGLSGGATYTLSKSMDNASSLGGGGGTVAQNDQDLAAEWALSSFDQRHRFSANLAWELPFGPNRKWLSGSNLAAQLFGGWILNGSLSIASGSPFTPRVIASVSEVGQGTNGTLRPDYTGAPIAITDPTIAQYFNTAAFVVPAAGTFGNASRNMIIGPGSGSLNAALMKTVQLPGTRGLSIRIQGTNVLNQVQYSTIDTTLGSPTYGRVIGARPMRSLQIILRVMY